MDLKQIVKKNKKKIVDQWFKATIETYPANTAKILGKDSNKFDNPVGSTTRETIEDVVDLLCREFTAESLETTIDPIVRIRAVQAFTAAEAVSFVFALKRIGEELFDADRIREFDRLVDSIALAAFNRYSKCKEEIYLLKATESKRRIHRAFERAGLVAELNEEDLLGSKKS
ncbi:MAG: hypothetical protein D3926_20710 [Desulfobacteraceae bacterium]|nr:MAG: hypothetical protein D3926_20710 [Desulfobacteraceae bacterium]